MQLASLIEVGPQVKGTDVGVGTRWRGCQHVEVLHVEERVVTSVTWQGQFCNSRQEKETADIKRLWGDI